MTGQFRSDLNILLKSAHYKETIIRKFKYFIKTLSS
jgi:hypothetical protein